MDAALEQLGTPKAHVTGSRPLPGSQGIAREEDLQALSALVASKGLPKDVSEFWGANFGARSRLLLDRALRDPATQERLDPELPYLLAQADLALEEELALTLDDLLSRRLPLLLRARDQGVAVAPKLADRMAQKLGWSAAQRQAQLDAYLEVVADSRRWQQPETVRRAG